MDVEYPYAEGLSRQQLLYRLPFAPQPRRLLVVSDTARGDLVSSGWGGPVTVLTTTALDTALTQGEARFDAVAMPWVLGFEIESATPRPGSAQLLRSAYRLLVPGGVVIGHLENMCTVRRLVRVRAPAWLLRCAPARGSIGSASGCTDALFEAGFIEPACYYVQPNIDSPMGLIPCAAGPSRASFLRSIRSSRGQYNRATYAAHLLVAFLGLGGMLQPELFFWARKPC